MLWWERLYFFLACVPLFAGIFVYILFRLRPINGPRLDHGAFILVYVSLILHSLGFVLYTAAHVNWWMSFLFVLVFFWLYGIYLPGVQRSLADRGHPWGRVPETAAIAVLRDRAFNEMHIAVSGELRREFDDPDTGYCRRHNDSFARNAFSVVRGGHGGLFWVGFRWDGFEIIEWYFHRGSQLVTDPRLRQSYTRHSISLRVESLIFHKQVVVKERKGEKEEETAIVTLTGEVVSLTSEERFDFVPIYDTGDPIRVSSSLDALGRFSGPYEALFIAKNPHDIIRDLILQEWRIVIGGLSFLPSGSLDEPIEKLARAFAERRSVLLPKAAPLLNVALGVWKEVAADAPPDTIVETITDVADDGTMKTIHFAKRYDDTTGYRAGDISVAGELYHKYGYFLLRVLVTDMEPADVALRTTFQKVLQAKIEAQAAILTAEGTKRVAITTAEGKRKAREEEGQGEKNFLTSVGEGRGLNIRNQIAALAGLADATKITPADAGRVVEVYLRHFYMEQMPAVTQTTSGKFVLPLPIMDALFGGRGTTTIDEIMRQVRGNPGLRDQLAKLLEPPATSPEGGSEPPARTEGA